MKITVRKALKADVRRDIIRLPKQIRSELKVETGDRIEIQYSNKSITARVALSDKELVGQSACRINSRLRRMVGAEIGDQVILKKKEDDMAVNLSAINTDRYDIVILEKETNHPFQISSTMVRIARRLAHGKVRQIDKAKSIFAWMQSHIRYGRNRRRGLGYRDSVEVKTSGEGVCGEQAILYVSMARCVGLTVSYVAVKVDMQGNSVNHACAGIKINGDLILVDPAYHTYDIRHKAFRVMKDWEIHSTFRAFRGT
jgi:transglutaminase-like putative cysteine protease